MPNTVLLRGTLHGNYDEFLASGSVTPGHLIEKTSTAVSTVANYETARVHSTRGGKARRLFAIEQGLLGTQGTNGPTIDTAYTTGEIVRAVDAKAGFRINALLHAGENVSKGDWLISYGDGSLCKAASSFLANIAAASTALSNTVTETAFSNGTVTIPKNTLKVGDVVRIRSQGIATATNSTDTLTVKAYSGSDQLATTGAVDVANNDIWDINLTLVVRTIGATGTMVGVGTVALGVAGTVTAKEVYLASTTIDTTADITLTVKGTWSVASSSNSCRQDILVVEHVKAGTSAGTVGNGGDVVGQAAAAVDNSAGVTAARVELDVVA